MFLVYKNRSSRFREKRPNVILRKTRLKFFFCWLLALEILGFYFCCSAKVFIYLIIFVSKIGGSGMRNRKYIIRAGLLHYKDCLQYTIWPLLFSMVIIQKKILRSLFLIA